MKSLLKAGAGIVALVAMAVILLVAFGPIERSRGQAPALAPTPAPTPRSFTLTPTPTPRADAPKPERPVVDPTWGTLPSTPYPVLPTPTPRPATGGPYISEAKAIDIAVAGARGDGQVDESIPPEALFITANEIPAILGKQLQGTPSPSAREFWAVWVHGRFKRETYPGPGEDPIVFARAIAIIDATSGEIMIWGLRDGR